MTVRVLRSGVLATVQDLGRSGLQHLAVVPGGAMDPVSHRLANALVGNFRDLATLEIALAGPELEFERDALIALHGARFEPMLDGAPIPVSRPVLVRAGARLRIGRAAEGAFGYLAIAGGIDVPIVLGGRSTFLPGGFGGLDGRTVSAGSIIPLVDDVTSISAARFDRIARQGRPQELPGAGVRSVRWFAPMLTLAATDPLVVRLVEGVHADLFEDSARAALVSERWRVAPDSNRMGYRLLGPKLALREPRDIVSQAVCLGTVQVPGGGQPIVLMADHQTTGGYARIAEVIAADLPRLAQATPGTAIVRFERVSLAEADAARSDLARRVDELLERLRWEFGDEND
jgi:biotin-dependent carboxylase-like uncharacterized protein